MAPACFGPYAPASRRRIFSTCHVLLAIAFLWLIPVPSYAAQDIPACIAAQIPGAARVGEGRMTYMVWDVYDAVLYAKNSHWQEGQPLALSLTYLQNLTGSKIVETATAQIRAQGFRDRDRLAIWQRQMSQILPDVEKGTNLTGILDAGGQTVFYRDGREIGRISDPAFGSRFFGIWLYRSTADPELRAELLGEVAESQ